MQTDTLSEASRSDTKGLGSEIPIHTTGGSLFVDIRGGAFCLRAKKSHNICSQARHFYKNFCYDFHQKFVRVVCGGFWISKDCLGATIISYRERSTLKLPILWRDSG
jgi:hypothetical protein